MLNLRGDRIICGFSRARALQGVSALALFATMVALPQSASAQVGPGSPQCPVTGTTVTCSGDVSGGVFVTPPDAYEQLILRNLTAPIRGGSNPSGAAVEFVNTNRPVTLTIEDPNAQIIPRGTRANGLVNIIGIRARTNADLAITNRARILLDAAQAEPLGTSQLGSVLGITAVYGPAASTVSVTNNGAIEITGFGDNTSVPTAINVAPQEFV